MKPAIRSLMARMRAHCDQIGIRPPDAALRHYALLRWLESCWWLAPKINPDRAEMLADFAYRLRLHELKRGTPLCLPDIAMAVRAEIDPAALAPWPDEPLMVSVHELL